VGSKACGGVFGRGEGWNRKGVHGKRPG